MDNTSTRRKRKAGRPRKGKEPRVRASFTLDQEVLHALKVLAVQRGLSASELLASGISELSRKETDVTVFLTQYSRLKTRLDQIARNYQIKRLSLFGSTLHGTARKDSDIDIIAEFLPNSRISFFELAELEADLSDLFQNKKIDLRTQAELSKYFRDTVLKEAVAIYGE